MEPIQSRGFTDPGKQAAEAAAIALAEQHTEQVLRDYAARADTYGGRLPDLPWARGRQGGGPRAAPLATGT